MRLNLTSTHRTALLCLLVSSAIFILWGSYLAVKPDTGAMDFKAIYYGARCVIDHRDPYNPAQFMSVYQAEGGKLPSDPAVLRMFREAEFQCVNTPSSLFVAAPLTMLPWGLASVLWMMLIAGSLMLAAFLILKVSGRDAPRLAPLLICMMLANSVYVLALANASGIAVGLCIVAVWCFVEGRFVPAGILCLALALLLKPHDAGFVWAYFLLAGGVHRRRALQTLLVVGVVAIPSMFWVWHVAPQWAQELHANVLAGSAPGNGNDPGPASYAFRGTDTVINLQSAIAIFRDEPAFYNVASYLVCGSLLLLGAVRTIRARRSQANAWFALAAIAALSMLPVYHRLYDAKLLLLTIPACAMLWARSGPLKWIAGLLNTGAIAVTADVPSTILVLFERSLNGRVTGIAAGLLDLILLRPAVPILLATGIFYLWVYLRNTAPVRALKEIGRLPEPAKQEAHQAVSLAGV